MSNPKQWIDDLESPNPKTRISARINLLRMFPQNSSENIQRDLSFSLYKDVKANPDTTVDYVLSIPDLQKKAYAIIEVNSGLKRGVPKVGAKAHPICRGRFLKSLEALVDDLDKIEKPEIRLRVGRIIAEECLAPSAMQALDKIWGIGYKTWIKNNNFEGPGNNLADHLAELAAHETREREVRTKALDYIISIPKKEFFEEPLKQVIKSSDDELSLKAAKAYILKQAKDAEGEPKPDRVRQYAESVLLIEEANPAAVSHAFDIIMKNTLNEEIARSLVYYQSGDFRGRLRVRGREFCPKGLAERVMHHLKEQVDNIGQAESLRSREDALMVLAARCDDEQIALKAADYLAKTSPRINGVHNIAQMYISGNKFPLSKSVKSYVLNLALDYIRDFKSLENKNLASSVLLQLGGWYDSSRPEDEVYGEGALFTEKATGIRYDRIARTELDKLNSQLPKKEDELRAVFGVTQ